MIQEESRCDFIIILIKNLFKMGMGWEVDQTELGAGLLSRHVALYGPLFTYFPGPTGYLIGIIMFRPSGSKF